MGECVWGVCVWCGVGEGYIFVVVAITHRLAIIAYWAVVRLMHLYLMVVSAVPYSKVHLVMAQNHCSRSIQSTSYTKETD